MSLVYSAVLYDSEKGEKRPRIGYCDRMNEFRMDDDGREGQNSDMRRQFNLFAASCYQRQRNRFLSSTVFVSLKMFRKP